VFLMQNGAGGQFRAWELEPVPGLAPQLAVAAKPEADPLATLPPGTRKFWRPAHAVRRLPKPGAGVENRTLLIFRVGEAPSPDDNPGVMLPATPQIKACRGRYLEPAERIKRSSGAYRAPALPLSYTGPV